MKRRMWIFLFSALLLLTTVCHAETVNIEEETQLGNAPNVTASKIQQADRMCENLEMKYDPFDKTYTFALTKQANKSIARSGCAEFGSDSSVKKCILALPRVQYKEDTHTAYLFIEFSYYGNESPMMDRAYFVTGSGSNLLQLSFGHVNRRTSYGYNYEDYTGCYQSKGVTALDKIFFHNTVIEYRLAGQGSTATNMTDKNKEAIREAIWIYEVLTQ